MKTILIPTDFNRSALNCIPALCQQFEGEELRIIYVHLFKLSDNMSDLLMLSRRSKEYQYVSDEFYQIANDLKKSHKQISSINIEFLYGSTLIMFRNFTEAQAVTHILNPEDCHCSKLNKSSLDPFILTAKSGLPLLSLPKIIPSEKRKVPAAPAELELAEV